MLAFQISRFLRRKVQWECLRSISKGYIEYKTIIIQSLLLNIMKLILDNINKISHAEINLNGLTVIVGENNTGKSTVGRVLFSLIKSVCNVQSLDDKARDNRLLKSLNNIRQRLNSVKGTIEYLRNDAYENKGLNIIRLYVSPIDFKRDFESYSSIEEYVTDKAQRINSMAISPRMKSLLLSDLESIKIGYDNADNTAAVLLSEFRSLAESEFLNQLHITAGGKQSIKLEMEDAESAVSIRSTSKSVDYSCPRQMSLADVTYIESPLYLHILDLLVNASPYHELGSGSRIRLMRMVPLHIVDFANKMSVGLIGEPTLFKPLSVDTEKIMNGHFKYDSKRKTLMFHQGDNDFYPLNVASGIKIFGVLQVLLDGGFIDATKPLIWDEPENHLHPGWQVEFAKILVQLSKSGIPVLITTHSPYFLQAVRYYAAKEKTEKYVDYYTSVVLDNGKVDMKNVTNNLDEVFRVLADPLNKIMNVDAARDGIEM